MTFTPALGGPDGVNPTSPNLIDRTSDSLLIAVQCTGQHQCVAVDRGGNEITFDPTTVQRSEQHQSGRADPGGRVRASPDGALLRRRDPVHRGR